MKKHYRDEDDCLNCGVALQGKFCHTCGQENLQIKESFGHVLNHAVSDYFHFDHQFFHTLKPLFFKPGFLYPFKELFYPIFRPAVNPFFDWECKSKGYFHSTKFNEIFF